MGATAAAGVRRLGAGRRWAMLAVVSLLIAIVVVFAANRLSVDVPHLLASTLPEDAYDRRFVEHPWAAYLHLAPGIV